VEKAAGVGSGFVDDCYAKAGAEIVNTPVELFQRCDMIMHVKEPMPAEYDLIREGQIIFTYLHLAADERQTRALIKSKAVCIAYETIQNPDGSLPLLIPMSEVAGRMAVQEGAKYLEMPNGGSGVLLGGLPGVDPGNVVVIGGGVLGGAVAFYLAKQNAGRVIVLERHSVAQGNSSLAAGLLTRGRFKSHLIPMVLETYQAIQEIEAMTKKSLGAHRTGCLYAAVSLAHQKEIRELVTVS